MKHRIALLTALGVASLAGPAAAMDINLGSGHFVVEADDTVDTYLLTVVDVPGTCQPGVQAVARGDDRIDVESTTPACKDAPYAVFKVNPQWQRKLDFQLSAGQLDFAASAMRHVASMQANVKAGDIFGNDHVERNWLIGARLQVDLQRPGIAVSARVGAGQITLSPDTK